MSGAFNIDIEVGAVKGAGNNIIIHCASLTEQWEITRSGQELSAFHAELSNDVRIKRNKIGLGKCPNVSDLDLCEEFLSRLGCTSAVLRVEIFHKFLAIPQAVCDGLAYASHKPFGKSLREGYMQKHPRFVRRGGGKKYMRLTKDERGGSLICYTKEDKASIIASIKIGASTQIMNLQDKVPNAFVVKSGKRQWVLQASGAKDYQSWATHLENLLKEFGQDIGGADDADDNDQKGAGSKGLAALSLNVSGSNATPQQYKKLKQQNTQLKVDADQLTDEVESMKRQLERLKDLFADANTTQDAMSRRVEQEFAREKDALIRDYELQQQNLETEIEELGRRINAKTAMEGGGAVSKLLAGFGLARPEDLKVEIDAEKKSLDVFTEDEKLTIKFMHKHLHRHTHKHQHTHKHIHLHKDAEDNVDNVDPSDFEPVDKHTISHTITHTNTQIKIQGSYF
eukprot:CAMPEP_0202690614 /NCGR_PEP_ID=MMETSP1385-20130828/5549_1 /ASSEMBLY_ACC=CAM_ASM_000861 /TAXON_ID=933848 /ORGANISM="Elphidium margaritaceum" /LENGTH=453 /DNA_ID=CAMNT_0049345891 /DNA_START=81 /DNA_END=1442 /DNA_ORIENTATION=+